MSAPNGRKVSASSPDALSTLAGSREEEKACTQGALAHAGGALQHDGSWPAGGGLVEPGAQQAQLS